MSEIMGIYAVQPATDVNYDVLEDNGLNTVFYVDGYLQVNINTCINNIKNVLKLLETTNIKLHIDIAPFKDSNSQFVNPETTSQKNMIKTRLEQLLTECELEGVSFDDYQYPLSFYDTERRVEQEDYLVSYADEINDFIKDINPKCLITASVGYSEQLAMSFTKLIGIFDYMITGIYGYGDIHSQWFDTTLKSVISKTGTDKLLAGIITWNEISGPTTPRTIAKIQLDMKYTLLNELSGYVLCNWDTPVQDLTFLRRRTRIIPPKLLISCIE